MGRRKSKFVGLAKVTKNYNAPISKNEGIIDREINIFEGELNILIKI